MEFAKSVTQRQRFLDRILVEQNRRYKNIPVADILYLKARGDHTEIPTKDQAYLSSVGISSLAEKLDPELYVKIHRSTVVNMNYVKEMYRDIGKIFLVMENGTELNVGRIYQPLS